MKNRTVLKSMLLAVVALVILVAFKPIGAKKDGFVSIFNGKNWDGWYLKIKSNDPETAKKHFSIED